MAASSKILATLITYPYQVIRARLQVNMQFLLVMLVIKL